MDISPKDVNVAYRFSTEPRTANFSHLKKAEHLASLFQQASRAANLTKSKKPFSVVLKDLNEQKKGVALKSRGQDKKVLNYACRQHEVDISYIQDRKAAKRARDATSDSESDTLRVDGEKVVSKKKKTASQWVVDVERDNQCDDHVGQACVKLTTGHHQLTKRDLGTWGMFLVSGSVRH